MRTLLKFWAPWCSPCEVMESRVKEALKDSPDINFEAINIDEGMAVATARGVKSIPTLILLNEDGEEQTRMVGIQSTKAIKNLLR